MELRPGCEQAAERFAEIRWRGGFCDEKRVRKLLARSAKFRFLSVNGRNYFRPDCGILFWVVRCKVDNEMSGISWYHVTCCCHLHLIGG